MFPLSAQEVTRLRSQIVISKLTERRGGRRYQVHAFTEPGVAMLSSVLRSETAVRVNIEIMRAFVRLRRAAIVSARAGKWSLAADWFHCGRGAQGLALYGSKACV
jgi:hypothetical protein